MNIQQLIKESVEKNGPRAALQWGKELRENREEYKRRVVLKNESNSEKDSYSHN